MTEHPEATSPTRQFAPLAIVLGIPLLFAAVFFYTTPVMLQTGGEQGIFKCGSPSSPNSEAKNVCQEPEGVQQNKAVYSGLSGLALVGLGAVWLLRGQQRDDEEWDEDRPRRRRDEDIDLRADDERGPTRSERLRGGPRDRRRSGHDRDRDRDREERRRERRSSRDEDESELDEEVDLDDELDAKPESRDSASRRREDDWSSDGWR